MVKSKSKKSLLLVVAFIALAVGFYMWGKQRQAQSGKSAEQSALSPNSLDALAKALFGGGSKTQQVQSGGSSSSTSVQAQIDRGPVVKLIGQGVKALGQGVACVAKGIGAGLGATTLQTIKAGGALGWRGWPALVQRWQ